ncbi:conserved eukaryotic protein, R3H domain-containing [Schizosaccharomyces osmophilus]|uniref:Conserved eukaryotic protein, R3H domain-containing n=1 Tax=Schizosaccharomyces osmophilus TaxID=2545709 RepID=A0AAE9WFP1_9SCHI|nr:conserved eukaryotic protein, R3H domain-containing [Schizosaccharomyces osmophilus]WBW75517.1 conserved eukaryotic protein, R3H domain-containing [Schizosaccharomyces osmophilus]
MVLVPNSVYGQPDLREPAIPINNGVRRINILSFQQAKLRNSTHETRPSYFTKSLEHHSQHRRRPNESSRHVGSRKRHRYLNDLHLFSQVPEEEQENLYQEYCSSRPVFGFSSVNQEFYEDPIEDPLLDSSLHMKYNEQDFHYYTIASKIRHELKRSNALQLVLLLDRYLQNILHEKLISWSHRPNEVYQYISESFVVTASLDLKLMHENARSLYRHQYVRLDVECPDNTKASTFARYWIHLICAYYNINSTSMSGLTRRFVLLQIPKVIESPPEKLTCLLVS